MFYSAQEFLEQISELYSIALKNSELKERLKDFIEYKGLNVRKFEEMCSMSNGYVSSMRKGLGSEKLNNVLNKFPDLNREWLLYGEGSMLNTPSSTTIDPPDTRPGMIAIPESVWNIIEQQANSLTARDKQIDVLLSTHERQIDEHNRHITELISIIKEQVKKTDSRRDEHAASAAG